MDNLFFILLLISFFLLILGLFTPKTSLFWSQSNQTRGKSTLIYGVATIIFFAVYGETANNEQNELKSDLKTIAPKTDNSKGANPVVDTDIALKFINGYAENSNEANMMADKIEWVNSSHLTTEDFKIELKRIINDAYKAEPEVGLDFDPILDAQDSPDKGFELESFDEKTNLLTVRGKDWKEFKLTIKIIEENGNWLVDGCGIVNIPTDKRALR
jgi:hypothetical protein